MRPRKQGGSAVVSPPFIPAFSACIAKTFEHSDGTTRPGRSVVEHCQIVGEVARVDRLLPACVTNTIPRRSTDSGSKSRHWQSKPFFL